MGTDTPSFIAMPDGLKTALEWLADAPLFADDEQITALYDAIVRPETETGKIVISEESLHGESGKLHGKVQGEVGFSSWIKTLLPFLDAKVAGEAGGEASKEESEKKSKTIELRPVTSPYRQLIQLTLHYAANLPHRSRVILNPLGGGWHAEDFVSSLPRALVFLEVPQGSKFIPMAAEGDNGTVRTLYSELKKKWIQKDSTPKHPSRGNYSDEDAYWDSYWKWYGDAFNAQDAMETVESVVRDGGRLRWLDYRVPLDSPGRPLHLHVCGRGRFDTGTFAYNLIKRGETHGLRIVGTLKSEPDMNVLAIFEK